VAFQNSYARGTGAPVTVTNTFTLLNPATQYTLKAFNGGLQNDKAELVSHSVVYLNGVQVVGPANFKQGVAKVSVTIFPGLTNTLSVQVRGKPGGVLAIQVIGVDNDPPSITASLSPSPNAAGWNNSPVTVSFTCLDKTSGVASCPPPITVSTEGANQVISGKAIDVAGNTATVNVTVNIALNFFMLRSWQVGPNGNAASPQGKCLDYGGSPRGNGATVFLNDCNNAHPIRVLDISAPPNVSRVGSMGMSLGHEVMLFAGNQVIGIHNPQTNSLGDRPSTSPLPAAEYSLELQVPFNSPRGGLISSPINQIFRLDGDSIILEGSSVDPMTGIVVPGPCVTTDATKFVCPQPPPQLVIQTQNARGTNGSPLVVGVRNLADNEFWDFNAVDGSGKFPTSGFKPVSTNYDLWNNVCDLPRVKRGIDPPRVDDPMNTDDNTPLNVSCSQFSPGWGTVIMLSNQTACNPVPGPGLGQTQDIGECINLSNYPPISLPAGMTLRGNRRGINFGPQLYFSYQSFWQGAQIGRQGSCLFASCMLEIHGDYARVTGLRMRGENRSTDTNAPVTAAIGVSWPGVSGPFFSVATTTQFISTIDHNDGSDWGVAVVDVNGPYILNQNADICSITYQGISNQYTQSCTSDIQNPAAKGFLTVADDAATLANAHVARNFLHHNERDSGGYGVVTSEGGRAFVEGNTFVSNRHDIASDGEPHNEYRAAHNLVLGNSPEYSSCFLFFCHYYHNQDFDMHGTENGYGGVAGFYVDIIGNTFLGTDRQNYWIRGAPIFNTDFHGNVSLNKQDNASGNGDAIQVHGCPPGITNIDCGFSAFPVNIFNNQFGASDPTIRFGPSSLGVGDFDGDGDDDLFLATGAGWYFSPAGAREWRFLNAAPDTIDQLLFGDFDGDGRTDVVALRNDQLVVSWGGISAFELLNANPLPCGSMTDMAVGDFDGDGHPDIFCADGGTWWISYGGNTPFVQVIVASPLRVKDLRFGDFNGDGTTDVFGVVKGALSAPSWQVRYGPRGYRGFLGGWQPLPVSLTSAVDNLYVADFNGDGIADVATDCGPNADPGCWQISYAGSRNWQYLPFAYGPYIAGIGHFLGHVEADLLSWNNVDFWISVGGISQLTSYSTQDMK
jgi:hypothetical protein